MDPALTIRLAHKDIVLPDIPCDGIIGANWHTTSGDPIFAPGTEPTYAEAQAGRVKDWHQLCAEYEANSGDFYTAYYWLNEHPVFWKWYDRDPFPKYVHEGNLINDQGMLHGVYIMVSKVNPETCEVDDDETKNTKTEVWVELMFQPWPHEIVPDDPNTYMSPIHAYMLDTGGDTYEQAIINAAFNVWKAVGNDRRALDADPTLGEPGLVMVVDSDTFNELMKED